MSINEFDINLVLSVPDFYWVSTW
eukprot:SAG31_NODE_4030_length_3649_cov_3.035493_5_plen_23_part_01